MKNSIKQTSLLFFLFFLINQNNDVNGQNNIPDLLKQRFQSYLESVPMEEIFIHTDRDEYISGEDLWFNIYLIDRQSNKPSTVSRIAYFELLNAENRPVVQKRIFLKNGFGPGQADLPDSLSSGTYTVRAYTNRMKNFLPYNCFVRNIRIYNSFSSKSLKGIPGNSVINQVIGPDSKSQPVFSTYNFTPSADTLAISINSGESFGVREKVSVTLEPARSMTEKLKSGNISVSVSPLVKGKHSAGLNDYLLCGSEFGFKNNVFPSTMKMDIPTEIGDSILLNIKSCRIDWPAILSGRLPKISYQTEKAFHILKGKLIAGEKSLPGFSEFVLLCMPSGEPGFQYAKTDSEGNFSFYIQIDESIKDLVLMPDDESRNEKIILESGFAEQYAPVQIAPDTGDLSIPQYITDWSVNYQVRKIYGVSASGSTGELSILPPAPVRFYGKPDIELIMADYVTLPKMEEVFFELLPHVSMKKRNQGYEILITDRINESRYESSPDLFLDGVKIKNASIFEELDPSIVERIDVIKERYFVGNYSFPGLINITTQSADFSTVPLPGYMIRLPYRVTEPVKSFFSPDYSSSDKLDSSIPDFRNTLYWNPSVKTDNEGNIRFEFWTSDFVSEYEINVQGLTSEGEVISARKTFRVE